MTRDRHDVSGPGRVTSSRSVRRLHSQKFTALNVALTYSVLSDMEKCTTRQLRASFGLSNVKLRASLITQAKAADLLNSPLGQFLAATHEFLTSMYPKRRPVTAQDVARVLIESNVVPQDFTERRVFLLGHCAYRHRTHVG